MSLSRQLTGLGAARTPGAADCTGMCRSVGSLRIGDIRSGNSKAGFVSTAVLLVLAAGSFNLRPQMLGYLFLILTLITLERFRQGKQRAVWLLPILFLIWINAHGSWIIGLGVVALYIACGLVSFQMGAWRRSAGQNRSGCTWRVFSCFHWWRFGSRRTEHGSSVPIRCRVVVSD